VPVEVKMPERAEAEIMKLINVLISDDR
jgi:hypothetical protein